jgi:N-carbamoyl-L-amino-acid hydrolase
VISLAELNARPAAEFVAALAGIFEHSPWVAERVASVRPFRSRLQLHAAMCEAVARASQDEQLALIRAHPELAGRMAARGELTVASTREQKGAGLADCSPEQLTRIRALNVEYSQRFGFPFVLAVKGHGTASIIAELERRVANDGETEHGEALAQIGRIAGFRLADLVDEPLGAQIMAMTERLAEFSEQADALTCSYLTPAHRQTAAQIREWMLGAGLETEIDAVGNVVGRLPARTVSAPDAALADSNSLATRPPLASGGIDHSLGDAVAQTLITGSHYDTVVDAGRYDGRLGIVLPIAVAGRLRRAGAALPFDLEIIAFAEEEGVRFKSTFLGSAAVAGRFDSSVLDSLDAQGISMREALRAAGLEPAAIASAARDPARVLGFIEVHIEQGPVLLSENAPLGVVTSIAGSTRAVVTIAGVAGHAGTVPMHLRKDAATAAAEIVLAVESRCSGTPGLVGTVGRLNVPNGAINVIPGRCELSIDIRSGDDVTRRTAFDEVVAASERNAARRDVTLDIRKVLEIDAVPCDPALQQRWAASIQRATGSAQVPHLPSGAGHDAMMMASLAPVGMLFVRCGNGGISHHPAESLTEVDAELAANAFSDFLTSFTAPV